MSKKRTIVRLNDGEIAVVGKREWFEHIVMTYEQCGTNDEENRAAWYEAADWIRRNLHTEETEDW